ncbi:FAST kinase domain-containing protein 2, mitochondrial-like isoform X2 [Arctopsyche grandis]|uniref:FAST kinase domain-containing protein 2, mitochondrial-like isoform X2 n=1 Tax=Arctopsyche grandis TaxID=121162 RepID=UPI00406D853D
MNVSPMCTFPNENPQSYVKDSSIVPKTKVTDILLDELKYANSHESVLKLVTQHHSMMNQKHVAQAMSMLFEFSKKNPEIFSTLSLKIIHHPAFESLTIQVKKYCRVMDMNEIVDLLKIMSYLEISGKSTIFQMLLQLVRQNINHLELRQVMFLDFILSKCDTSNLAESLKLAMPLVFQLQLGVQMDQENVPHLAELLQFATRNDIPDKYVNNILACLLLQSKNIDVDSAKNILISLIRLPRLELHSRNLLNRIFNIMTQNIDHYSYEVLIRVLNVLKNAVCEKSFSLTFYNEDFLAACTTYTIKHDLGFEKGMQISKLLCNMGYDDVDLLEYISDIIVINPESLNTPFHLLQYVSSLSHANYKPQSFETIKPLILDNPAMDSNKRISWVKCAVELASLDCYSDKLLSKIYTEDFFSGLLDKHNQKIDYIQLLYLHYAVSYFYPSFTNVNTPDYILKGAMDVLKRKEVNNNVASSLELALGGEKYFASNVKIPNGFIIDFMIAYRDGNYPIALNQSNKEKLINFEDLNLESYTKLVWIVGFHKGCYTRNNKKLRGIHSVFLKILEHLNCDVVPISLLEWHKLPSYEKVPYIMNEINLKLNDTSNSSEERIQSNLFQLKMC